MEQTTQEYQAKIDKKLASSRDWKRRNQAKTREYMKNYKLAHPDYKTKPIDHYNSYMHWWENHHTEWTDKKCRQVVHIICSFAKAAGLLKPRASCSRCKHRKPVQMHHEDYNKVLHVQWVCRKCHNILDKERRARLGIVLTRRLGIIPVLPNERQQMCDLYGYGFAQTEIGPMYGRSNSTVSRNVCGKYSYVDAPRPIKPEPKERPQRVYDAVKALLPCTLIKLRALGFNPTSIWCMRQRHPDIKSRVLNGKWKSVELYIEEIR